jgi:hypothetical protein
LSFERVNDVCDTRHARLAAIQPRVDKDVNAFPGTYLVSAVGIAAYPIPLPLGFRQYDAFVNYFPASAQGENAQA